jgi:hypothetical protein
VKQFLKKDDKFTLLTPKNLRTRPSLNDNRNATIDLTLCTPNLAHLSTTVTIPYWGINHLPFVIEIKFKSTTHTHRPILRFEEKKWYEWNVEIIEIQLETTQQNQNAEASYNVHPILCNDERQQPIPCPQEQKISTRVPQTMVNQIFKTTA